MINKTRIEISLVLPQVSDARDACVERLPDLLAAKEGVHSTHILDANEDQPNQICVHHDSDRLSIAAVRELARRAGADKSRIKHKRSQPEQR